MQIKYWANKWHIHDANLPERMQLNKLAVGIKKVNNLIILDDNIFNRVLLGTNYDDKIKTGESQCYELNAKARDYQQRDIMQMLHNRQTLNRNKPGYGKTFESIEYCRMLNLSKILIVCPKSVMQQWKTQFKTWWPEVEQDVIVGSGVFTGDRKILVTNYDAFIPRKKSGAKAAIPTQTWLQCKKFVWDIIILDESHRIKNKDSKTTLAIKDLPALRMLPMTGTPILGHPDDLWSQLNFMGDFYSGKYWDFIKVFCEIEHNGFGRKPIGLTPSSEAKDLLTKVLNIITVGGENHKVTEGKNIIPIDIDMDPAQRRLYKEITDMCLDSLQEKGITVKNAMDQIIKQQQVTTNCTKFTRQESDDPLGVTTVVCPRNPKFEWVRDWLEDNDGEKLVVYSKFAETAKSLHSYLTKAKIKSTLYTGDMDGKTRLKAKDDFVQLSEVKILIGTIGALGTGVDGLQKVCRNVVFLDRDWTPGINEQAEDRVNRSGQVGMTNIWILHAKHTIDEYVEGICNKKASDIEEVFRHVNSSIRSGE